jgi:hypothetical protein
MIKTSLSLFFRNWLLLCPICTLSVQAQDILWEKSYGGKHADYLLDAQPTADYGFILGGSSLSKKTGTHSDGNKGDLDYWIWKMDENGEQDWQRSLGGSGSDLLQSIRLTNDGGFILAGTSDSPKGLDKKQDSFGGNDFWIIKLDAGGGEQWQQTIGGTGEDDLVSVSQTTDGGYILAGSSCSARNVPQEGGASDFYGKTENSFGNLDYWIVKLDNKGSIAWQRTLGGQYADILTGLEQTADGGYILGGYSNSPESGNKTTQNYGLGDYWIVRLDKDGKTQWQKSLGGEKDDHLRAIHQSFDGNYIAAGSSNSGSGGNKNKSNRSGTDFWVVKFDEKGEILWQQTYDNGKVDILTSLVENKDHSLLLGGYSQSETQGTKKKDKEGINDYLVIKTKEDGEQDWIKTVGSGAEDILRKATQTRDGGYLLAGTSTGKVSKDRNSAIGRNDFWVVKLKDKQKPKEEKQAIEAIPNPAQDYTDVIVGYDFEKGTATVFDITGHILQEFAINSRTVPVNLESYPQGIYIVKISTNVQSDGVKVIKGNRRN